MRVVGKVIQATLSAEQSRRFHDQRAISQWEDVVGAQIARVARPQSIRKGTLYVVVSSTSWSTELTMLKPQIIERLSQVVGDGCIHDIVFRTGRVSVDTNSQRNRSPNAGVSDHRKETLTRPERASVSALLTKCEDLRLQKAVRECAEETLRMRKHRRKRRWRECNVCGRQSLPGTEICQRCGRPLVLGPSALREPLQTSC